MMQVMRKSGVVLSGLLMLGLVAAVTAQATPVFFTDRASFDAAAGALSFEDFEGNFSVGSSQVFTDFTVSETGGINALGQLRDFPSLGVNAGITSGTGALVYDDNGSSIANFFSFSGPVNAFGLDVTTSAASTMTVGGSVGTSFGLGANAPAFFGVIDTMTTFTTITFNASGGPNVAFDAASYGIAGTPVPEPTSMILFGSGLLGLAAYRRFKKTA